MTNEKSIKWHIVFDQIANALFDFYSDCRSRAISPGEELYTRLLTQEDFVDNNPWIDKFKVRFGMPSIDPIHLFASLNSNRSPYKNRSKRVKILLSFFKIAYDFEVVDFDGCPAPRMIQLLSTRKPEYQKQIWDFFSRLYINDRPGLEPADFYNFKSWRGIELSSFTIFLFWIKSDFFLPIEKNTRTFLGVLKLRMIPTKDYESYLALVELIDEFNLDYNNEFYFQRGLFREITHVSYNVVAKGNISPYYSPNLRTFLAKNQPSFEKTQHEGHIPESETPQFEEPRSAEDIVGEIKKVTELGFNIIALTALDGCSQDHLNILKKNQIYHFEKIIIIDGQSIKYHKENYFPFYNTDQNAGDGLTINVTAIVGKNGTGKSSLIELLFKIINNITFNFKAQLHTTDIKQVTELEAELYYVASGILYSVYIKNTEILIQQFSLNLDVFEKYGERRPFTFQDLNTFFYTIATNYSHYALNSEYLDDWIDELFHKNDSYQTPLVINPMRTAGNININVENDLVRYRLLANLFMPMEDEKDIGIRQVTDKQIATKIDFKFIVDKNKVLYKKYPDGKELRVLFSQLKNKVDDILRVVTEVFGVSFDLKGADQETDGLVIEETKKYIVRKLVKIAVNYSNYKDYFDEDEVKLSEGEALKEYLTRLKGNKSHITYKLSQAINYFKCADLYVKEKFFQLDIIRHTIELDNYRSNREELKSIDIIELLPPPIFEPIIWLKNEDGSESEFDKLSSGEKQFIHTIGSLLYHINNLESVNYSNESLVIYRNINILMDEIELYYHPELQREYLSKALALLKLLSVPNIDAVNICFVTHSPFILSDIPNTNILFLNEKGLPDPNAELEKTFGANVHDLLKHSFFLTKGTIGEVAKSKIRELTKYLQQPLKDDSRDDFWDIDKAELLISKIGEPIIKERLLILFDKKFHSDNNASILRRIELLQAELNK